MSALDNMIGETIGDLRVIARAGSARSREALWEVECPKGHRFVRSGAELRRRSRTGGRSYCPECIGAKQAEPGAPLLDACSLCGSLEHKRQHCAKRAATAPKICPECCDLPHCRPEGGVCKRCHRPWMPEQMPTLKDVMARPYARREVI